MLATTVIVPAGQNGWNWRNYDVQDDLRQRLLLGNSKITSTADMRRTPDILAGLCKGLLCAA